MPDNDAGSCVYSQSAIALARIFIGHILAAIKDMKASDNRTESMRVRQIYNKVTLASHSGSFKYREQ